ncbi:MAG: polysaccharide deacetylase family protein, partial [Bacteroidota bacterium]|nr:polysaccharide deacetylase family protein [Bacteroidota bacterium]
EVYAVTIAEKLIEKGHNVFIISDTLTKSTSAKYHTLSLTKRSFFNRVRNVKYLTRFIKENNIQIVHAHSRASAWVSCFACKICRIPLITTVHGRQSTHLSRKLIKGFGNYSLAVCEEIEKQLVRDLGLPKNQVEVLRNGFEIDKKETAELNVPEKPVVTYITRLSGPKGELALQLLEKIENNRDRFKNIHFRLVGGQEIPEKFLKFRDKFEFIGYIDSLKGYIDNSSVVIGAGRIAVEALLRGKPTIAVGEATSIGLIDPERINYALQTNFGDMAEFERMFDFDMLLKDIEKGVNERKCHKDVREKIIQEFDINRIAGRIEYLYQSILVRYHKREIPVVMYHRIIESKTQAGRHGIYVTAPQFEEHMKYLKDSGYETIGFDESLKINRLDVSKKYIIITFDDGYKDNYELAFPILRKYNFKAVIFLVAGLDYNKWDCTSDSEPRLTFMNREELLEMQHYGITFGAHTLTHPDLSSIGLDETCREISQSKKILEEKLSTKVNYFAYPYGALNDKIKEIAASSGFTHAIATDSGPIGIHEDLYHIRRIGIFPNTNLSGFKRKVKGNYTFRKIKDRTVIENIPTPKIK